MPDFEAKTIQQALFLEDAFNVTEQLKLSAGVRQDWIKLEHDSLLNNTSKDSDFAPFAYRLGAVFQATPSTMFYGQYSEGSDPVTSLVTARPGSSVFKLTSAKQAETGIKHILPDGKGELTLAVYHIEKDDILTRNPNNPGTNVQGGSQSSRGIELATTLLPVDHWRADLNMAVLDARYDKLNQSAGGVVVSRAGNTPTDVPEKTANAWLYYQQPNWEAGIGARMVGKRYADSANTSVMSGYTVYDANIAWRANSQTTLRLNLRNLTDKLYAPVSYDTQQFIVGEFRRAEIVAEFRY